MTSQTCLAELFDTEYNRLMFPQHHGAIEENAFNQQPLIRDSYLFTEDVFVDLDISNIDVVKEQGYLAYSDVVKVMPTGIGATSDTKIVAKAVADNIIRLLLNNPKIKEARVAKIVNAVTDSIKTNISLGKTNEICHRLALQLFALSSKARLLYTGYMTADVNFSAETKELRMNLYKTIAKNTSVGFTHSHTSAENFDLINLNFGF